MASKKEKLALAKEDAARAAIFLSDAMDNGRVVGVQCWPDSNNPDIDGWRDWRGQSGVFIEFKILRQKRKKK